MRHRILLPLAAVMAVFVPALCFAAPRTDSPYSVVVSVESQRTYVYKDGRLVRSMICSTGIPDTDDATPLGDYTINESGKKRGEWFFSERYGQGAKYWVGFIGGTYLFHSLAMDRDQRIIPEEAAKLGKPASHGCIRLGMEDAYWFYTTVPDRTPLRILARHAPADVDGATAPDAARGSDAVLPGASSKAQASAWLAANMRDYRQAYTLSCEIALIRVALALMGVRGASEDDILATIPRRGSDPERAFVCDDIRGGRRAAGGRLLWNNYGTHPPVVVAELARRMAEAGVADRYAVRELRADDSTLRSLVTQDPAFLGAIVWLVGHPERWGAHPPVNERGMVLGEHVRFLEPALAADGRFRLWDPETGKLLVAREAGAARDLFSYRIVGVFRTE